MHTINHKLPPHFFLSLSNSLCVVKIQAFTTPILAPLWSQRQDDAHRKKNLCVTNKRTSYYISSRDDDDYDYVLRGSEAGRQTDTQSQHLVFYASEKKEESGRWAFECSFEMNCRKPLEQDDAAGCGWKYRHSYTWAWKLSIGIQRFYHCHRSPQ